MRERLGHEDEIRAGDAPGAVKKGKWYIDTGMRAKR
jgi:hypothetical protein